MPKNLNARRAVSLAGCTLGFTTRAELRPAPIFPHLLPSPLVSSLAAVPSAATLVIVMCIAALVVVVVLGIYRIHLTHQQEIKLEETAKEEDTSWDNSALKITVNPMEV